MLDEGSIMFIFLPILFITAVSGVNTATELIIIQRGIHQNTQSISHIEDTSSQQPQTGYERLYMLATVAAQMTKLPKTRLIYTPTSEDTKSNWNSEDIATMEGNHMYIVVDKSLREDSDEKGLLCKSSYTHITCLTNITMKITAIT